MSEGVFMSELNPEAKAQLIKQVQEIADGVSESDIVKNEAPKVDIKEQIVSINTPVQTKNEELVIKNNPVTQVLPVQIPTQVSSQMTTTAVQNKDQKIDPMILTVAVFAMLVLGGLFLFNKFGDSRNQQQYPQQQPYINNVNNPYEYHPQELNGPHLDQRNQYPNQYPNSNDIKSYVDKKIDVLGQRVDRLDHRTWLLAVANNENATVSRKIADHIGGRSGELGRKYISFDSNWNLNKMPEFIRLTSEQRYSLLEEVDDRNYQKQYNYEYDYKTRTYRPVYVPQVIHQPIYQPQVIHPQPIYQTQPQVIYSQNCGPVYPMQQTYPKVCR
jgi:hypothetical protein